MAYDPFAPLGLGGGMFSYGSGQGQRAPRLDAQQEESLLQMLGRGTMGGINYVAEAVTKPQAALFGLLAGDPAQLANLIPFSDTMGLTNPEDRYDFRDVLDTWGVSPQNVEGFRPFDNPEDAAWDAVGLAGDIFVDPLLPVGLGGKALTGAGKVAKAAGLLENLRMAKPLLGPVEARMTATLSDLARAAGNAPGGNVVDDAVLNAAQAMGLSSADVAGMVDEPVGSLFSYGPWSVGKASNPVALKAGQLMDQARSAALFNPVMKPITSLFSAPAGQASSTIGQDLLMPAVFSDREAARAAARKATAEAVSELELSGSPLAAPTEDASDALRQMVEGVTQAPPELTKFIDFLHNSGDANLQAAREWGVKKKALNDPTIKWSPRRMTENVPKKGGKPGEKQIVTAFDQSAIKRADPAVGIEGGTVEIKRLAKDEEINAIIDNPDLTRSIKLQMVSDVINERFPQFRGTFQPRRALQGAETVLPTLDRPAETANWLAGMSPEVRESGIYGNHLLIDFAADEAGSAQSVSVAKRLVTALADDDFLTAAEKTSRGGLPGMTVRSLLKQVGLDTKTAIRKMAELKQLPTDKATLKRLANRTVPGDLAKDVTRYHETFNSPQAAQEIGGIFDSITNLYRAGVTSPWPAFHARNLLSGLYNNWLLGAADLRSYGEARSLLNGESVDVSDIPVVNMELNMREMQPTPENSSRVLREILYAEDAAPRHAHYGAVSMAHDDVLGGQLTDITSQRVGEHPFSLKETAQTYLGMTDDATLNPLKSSVRGVNEATESTFGPLAGGDKLGSYVEGLNRVAPMISLLRQGVDPAEAARRVGQAQVKYARRYYTDAEQKIAQYGVPFYKFSRQMIPFTIEQIAEAPGGKLSKTLQVLDSVRGDLSAAPDYVQETTGISLGEQEDGTNRYITGLGLPFEDTLAFLGGGPQQALLELASRANPLLKFPAEWATGQSFFQRGPEGGRDLEDLDPTLGRTLANLTGQQQPVNILGNLNASRAAEALVANSPLARLTTSLRTATDPRKGIAGRLLNLGTGVRISDISPAAEDAVIRERINRALKEMGAEEFTRVYYPDSQEEMLSASDQLLVQQLEAQQNTLVDRSKERKAAAANPLTGAGSL